jgi:hypothetical protein
MSFQLDSSSIPKKTVFLFFNRTTLLQKTSYRGEEDAFGPSEKMASHPQRQRSFLFYSLKYKVSELFKVYACYNASMRS